MRSPVERKPRLTFGKTNRIYVNDQTVKGIIEPFESPRTRKSHYVRIVDVFLKEKKS
jgi:hypothetical protein